MPEATRAIPGYIHTEQCKRYRADRCAPDPETFPRSFNEGQCVRDLHVC